MAIHGSTLPVSLAIVTKGVAVNILVPSQPEPGGGPSPGFVKAPVVGPDPADRFLANPAVLRLDTDPVRWVVYAVTTDGRLAQFEHADGQWRIDFPLDMEELPAIGFAGTVTVIHGAGADAREIFATSTGGRLVRVLLDGDRVTVDFPAELAEGAPGQPPAQERVFAGAPVAIEFDAAARKRLAYCLTSDGELIELWGDGDRWQLGYPAEEAGDPGLRFRGGLAAALARKGQAEVTKHLAGVTTDGKLVELTGKYGVRGAAHYGGESRFRGDGIGMFTGPADYGGLVLAAVTTTGRLVCFDAAGRTVEPAALAEHPESDFTRVVGGAVADGWIHVHAITAAGTIVELRSGKIDAPPLLTLPWSGWSYMRLASFDELEGEEEREARRR
jgi:hypothetical protein